MKHGMVVAVGVGLSLVGVALAPSPAWAQTREVSRSSPIVAEVGVAGQRQYQGSFEVVSPTPPVRVFEVAADAATFEFPYTRGHLRAIDVDDIGSSAAAFAALTAAFDAADAGRIPAPSPAGCALPFSVSCRTVFTTVAGPDADGLAQRPPLVFFSTTNLAAIKPLLAPTLADPDATVLMERVLAGVPDGAGGYLPGLGGIDRSTLAVVEPSPFIPNIAGDPRATMIYVGALDGMIHAICAEVRGPCLAEGQELWAFIPRTQLGLLRLNTQRIDGSIRVADVFDDFDLVDPAVVRQYRTVLTVQTGTGDPADPATAPSIVALDVSNPGAPIVLWERTTPAVPDPFDFGVGLGLAMAPAKIATQVRNLTFAQTNNGGSSPESGFYLAAIDSASGVLVWEFAHDYPDPRTVANPEVPDRGIPGGPAVFDVALDGLVSHVAVSSLYGDLWILRSDGVDPYLDGGGEPLPVFRFSTDFHPIGAPPTIYFDQTTGRFAALVVSGGYADPVAATWLQEDDDQFAVSVSVDPAPGLVPLDEVTVYDESERPIKINLGTGSRVTAQAVIAGNELFIVADKTDTNLETYGEVPDTGALTRYSLSSGAQKGSVITIAGGGSSLAGANSGTMFVGSGGGAQQVDVGATGGGGAFDAAGRAIERFDDDNNARLLWLNG